MQFSALLALTLAVPAPAVLVNSSIKLDINQKVYIENAPVLGDGAGEAALGQCSLFAPQHIANPAAPTVKVCGTGIKTTIFLRNRCKEYYTHSKVIGKCDSGMPASTCESMSAAGDPHIGAYQSYMIEQC